MNEKGRLDELEETIASLLADPLLSDITSTLPTEKELDDLISLEQGQAYRIQVTRGPLPTIELIVRQASTVRDIKMLFEHAWAQRDENKQRPVSWKYIWRTYCLQFKQQRLLKDEAVVSQIGIQQGSILTFTKLRHDKCKHRKAWRWAKGH